MSTNVPPRGPKKGQVPPRGGASGRGGKGPARGRQAAFQRQQQQKRIAMGGVALVVVVILVVVVVALTRSSGNKAQADTPAPTNLVNQIIGVTPATMAVQARNDTLRSYPTASNGATLTAGGKPKVVYIGGEFCPYCAGERWSMVMALSKFGTFSGLKLVTSMSTDTVASVPTFSFFGSTYKSNYLVFDPTETQTVAQTKLQTPTKADAALLAQYDSGGSIPFVDIGGKWLIVGISYDDSSMQSLSYSAVAQAASAGSTKYGADIQATAGMITSRLCKLTGGQPGSVCKYFPNVINS